MLVSFRAALDSRGTGTNRNALLSRSRYKLNREFALGLSHHENTNKTTAINKYAPTSDHCSGQPRPWSPKVCLAADVNQPGVCCIGSRDIKYFVSISMPALLPISAVKVLA